MAQNYGRLIEDVHGSGIYPSSGPFPPGNVSVRTAGQLGHPEEWRSRSVTSHTLENVALLAGRAIYGGYFLYSGINHFVKRKMLGDYARAKGVKTPNASVVASGLMIIAGGASLLLGVRPKLGAGLISGFLIGVSPQIHGFWKETDPQQRMQEMVNFSKNMALIGASLFAAAQPEPWRWRVAPRRPSEALVALR